MAARTKKVVFLTGASGVMGGGALRQFAARLDQYQLKILVQPSEAKKRSLRPYLGKSGIEIIWGDLTRYDDVYRGVQGSDIVLHVAAMVSPYADRHPETTTKVNLGGTRNIVKAVQDQPNADRIKLVYIGTVAETGNRNPPIHWGRTGDPIKLSIFDHYAVSKTRAEAVVADSGLKHWVSLRQTAIMHVDMWKTLDPIMFHVPINGVFEWITASDSGRLMLNICDDGVPNDLWRDFYNIGGGASCRVVNHEFMKKCCASLGVNDLRAAYEPNWFALRNFHGQWYSDSDRLEALVPYRKQSLDDFFTELKEAIPFSVRAFARLAPGAFKRRLERLAESEGGSMYWMTNDDEPRIAAFFGSRDAWHGIAGWEKFKLEQPAKTPFDLDHGFDETKDKADWTVQDLHKAALFRGGEYLSGYVGDPFSQAVWRCALGHEFALSPNLMLAGGHWCPTCMTDPSCYREVAHRSPFFAQVWQEG